MRLGIVTPYPPALSGIGQYGFHLTRALGDFSQFERIAVFANRDANAPAYEAWGRVAIERVWQPNDPRVFIHLRAAIRRACVDALWFNFGFSIFGARRLANMAGLFAPLWAKGAGYRVVLTLHALAENLDLARVGIPPTALNRWGARLLTRLLIPAADAVIVTTRANEQLLRRSYNARNIHLIPLPVYYQPERLVEPNGHREILMFTTHAPFKGLPLLLDAFREIHCQHPEARLTIAGGEHPRFPGYMGAMREKIREAPGVRWLGALPEADVSEVMAQSSVVVLPYQAATGASSVLPQACAFGLPIVASDLPDWRAVAEEANLRVEFFQPNDRNHLVEVLSGVLFDPARQAEIGRHNVAIVQRWSLRDISRHYAQLFNPA